MNLDFKASSIRRLRHLEQITINPQLQVLEKEWCRRDPVYFFNNYVWTYDPRIALSGGSAYIPFDLFKRQEEAVRWLDSRLVNREEGLWEKSRDVGCTWIKAGYAVNKWLFVPGFKITFGSRSQDYVDVTGNPDSFFERMRLILYRLPKWMLPLGFQSRGCDSHERLINPENGSTITGEVGDNMGRGGRSTLYLVDEGAFLEHAEKVEASINSNADCRIWASSVNGPANLFARKRFGGGLRQDQVFRFHWRDDPRKDDEWAKKKQQELRATPHIWASEHEIDYSASVEGVCIPARWVEAAVRLGEVLDIKKGNRGIAGLDVGAGKAMSVFIARFGPVVQEPIAWQRPDTTETAFRAMDAAQEAGCSVLRYDSVGVGQGVQSTLSYHKRRGLLTVPVNVGIPPSERIWPNEMTSEDMFANMKAEAWWLAREKFKASHEHLLWLQKEDGGIEHHYSDLITLPRSASELIMQLGLPKVNRNERGKLVMESKTQLANRGIASPDYAEALVLTFCQVEDSSWELNEQWSKLVSTGWNV